MTFVLGSVLRRSVSSCTHAVSSCAHARGYFYPPSEGVGVLAATLTLFRIPYFLPRLQVRDQSQMVRDVCAAQAAAQLLKGAEGEMNLGAGDVLNASAGAGAQKNGMSFAHAISAPQNARAIFNQLLTNRATCVVTCVCACRKRARRFCCAFEAAAQRRLSEAENGCPPHSSFGACHTRSGRGGFGRMGRGSRWECSQEREGPGRCSNQGCQHWPGSWHRGDLVCKWWKAWCCRRCSEWGMELVWRQGAAPKQSRWCRFCWNGWRLLASGRR